MRVYASLLFQNGLNFTWELVSLKNFCHHWFFQKFSVDGDDFFNFHEPMLKKISTSEKSYKIAGIETIFKL